MKSLQSDANRADAGRVALITLVALSAVLLVGLLSGCGGKPEAQPDTGATPTEEPLDEIPVTTPDEQPAFPDEADAMDQDTVAGEDMEAETRPLPVVQDVFFGYDSFELDAEAQATLQTNARILRRNPDVDVIIEGHCDERGTAQYNMALGWKRANTTKDYLVSLRIPASRIRTVSFGKEKPFVTGSGEDVWSLNRRAHIVLERSGR
ncbi:MAG TPA: OmpA family protein [Candidatus Krumholzibacteria bacterium]|nr:OmpA family protein [Candidatus Krumholzibacteria bacterium]